MARKDNQIRQQIATAASHLRDTGKPDLADAIDLVLAPAGWGILRRSDPDAGDATSAPNLPIRISATDRDRIRAAQEQAGTSLIADATEGLNAFIAGEFSPEQPARSVRGSGEEKVVINVRIDEELRKRVEQAAEERADELGWKPRPMHVIREWLIQEKYPAPKASRK
ncbi:hypothetical protein ACWGH4_00165 [Streptomyces sp. NPDC054847]